MLDRPSNLGMTVLDLRGHIFLVGASIAIALFQLFSFGIDFNARITYGFKYNFFNEEIVSLDPYLTALKSLAPPSRALFDWLSAFVFSDFYGFLFLSFIARVLYYNFLILIFLRYSGNIYMRPLHKVRYGAGFQHN